MSEYRLPRDAAESDRLDTQNLIYKETLGYLLHPSIPVKEPFKLVDIGCGTGSYITLLAAIYPRSTFVGYDISSEQFPETSTLPPNVELRTHSILEAFPANTKGSFDIATLRLVGQAIPVDQRRRAIENVISLVVPGGHVQWIEPDHLEKVQIVEIGRGSRTSQLGEWSRRNADALGWKVETDFGLGLSGLLSRSVGVHAVREEVVPIGWSTDPKTRSAVIDNTLGIFRVALDDWIEQGRGMSDSELKLGGKVQVQEILREAEAEMRAGEAEYVYWIHVVVARVS